ncbi:MAG: nucleoside deaminase [Clostridia bacterium]|nr:nucleoside deaminase [Clostridia bacterium]
MNKQFMLMALNEAEKAAAMGEIPVGAVIVKNGEVVAAAHNTREAEQNALAHAEINAINSACRALSSWRLDDCEIYVTMEPCPMCAGAIINARIPTVVFGCYDLKMGSFDSVVNLSALNYDFKPEVYGGIMEKECTDLVKSFFKDLRKNDA